MHWIGLTELINAKGGLRSLVGNRLLQAVLMWFAASVGRVSVRHSYGSKVPHEPRLSSRIPMAIATN